VVCSNCQTENEPGRKFCSECGSPLALICAACGTSNTPTAKFCGECGTPLTAAAPATSGVTAPQPAQAERRLVSVLFADLVGFTAISEARDAEEVRDLLTRYFDTATAIVTRYGGTIEKFIGDAVMAVWGAPVAKEDDAERAVRAALDLVAAVSALGQDLDAPDLQARAGVLTGQAAVTLHARDQGMVAGDLVNTAARIQAAAEPGTVLVGDSTREATEAAVVYAPAGTHELKGKAEPIALHRALRVVALVGGALKSVGLEAPFVGRDREFRMLKELFHASAEDGRAHLVSAWGIAGIGKSRLSWEFFKYIDGLAQLVLWHRGRCLPYGEGVTYWALAEMVRGRAQIAEGEDPSGAAEKLHASVAQYVSDPDEQRWVEPRLAHLVGLETAGPTEPEELFSAWRLFFERLTVGAPVVMVFEDLQWADAGLLDFIEYLLEWSRNHRLFVITLARPELADRRPGWGAGKRNFTSLNLEPLGNGAMEQLLDGLVPGLTDEVRQAILDRAEGVPLYAVETVRMLIDRGLLVRDGAGYRPTEPITALEVPRSLHALIAARLDGLEKEERRLIQHAAVLGKTFGAESLAALASVPEPVVRATLTGLVRKELLALQSDPRSPERGQYGFLQDLVKRVAYETLSKRDRRALHLAAARHLETAWGGEDEDIVEIVAFHLVEAYGAVPDAPDAGEIRSEARRALVRAGERARSLAAMADAQAYFDQAFELADDDAERARISEQAGRAAQLAGRAEVARDRLERAVEVFRRAGLTRDAARASAQLGEVLWLGISDIKTAVETMDTALAALSGEEPDERIAELMHQAARLHYFVGEPEVSMEWVERALVAAESGGYVGVISQALNTKSLIYHSRGRWEEARALLHHSLALAERNDLTSPLMRALFNLANDAAIWDRWEEARRLDERHMEMVRRQGARLGERMTQMHFVLDDLATGRWDEVLSILASTPASEHAPEEGPIVDFVRASAIPALVGRGRVDEAASLAAVVDRFRDGPDEQDILFGNFNDAIVFQAQGRLDDALASAERSVRTMEKLSLPTILWPLETALECAFDLGRVKKVEELLRILEEAGPTNVPPFGRALGARFRARLAALAGDHDVADEWFRDAASILRTVTRPYPLAMVLLERAEALIAAGRAEEAGSLLGEARAIFEDLDAKLALRRLEAVAASAAPSSTVVPA